MKILFIPNWQVKEVESDDTSLQAPNKHIKGEPYWFFKYFPTNTTVDIIDIGENTFFRTIEKKIKFYIVQPFKAFICRNKYEVVISHGAQSGLVYELLCSFVSKKPKHIIIDIGGLNGSRINNIETPLLRFALRKKPYIIIHSSSQYSLYKNGYPFLSDHIRFIPFGIDFHFFETDESYCDNYILSFGYAKRDYQTLINAYKNAENNKDIPQLEIIGYLPTKEISTKKIKFTDNVPIIELMNKIKRARFIIIPLPEYNYSYGQMSFLQSMAMGKVVLVTETTSSIDYLKKAPGAFLTKPYSIEEMAKKIEYLASIPIAKLMELGIENKEYIKKNFHEKEMGMGISNFITDI